MDTDVWYSYEYIKTDRFENLYEEELKINQSIRKDIINNGIVVYIHNRQGLVGECYGATPEDICWIEDDEEGLPDTHPTDTESIYVYSTTILPAFQSRGYGTLLIKEFARHASDNGYIKLLGHTTTEAIKKIRENQGAIFRDTSVHKNWYGSKRTACFYTQFLTQDKDYNCGPVALAYLLETRGYYFLIETLEKELLTDPTNGTDPMNIFHFLSEWNIKSKVINSLQSNSIIDITVEGDGHWIVLIEPMNKGWKVYDPAVGVCIDESNLMEKWISPRYGKNKGFQVL